jgi:uncharacterized protein with GYD domain
VIFFSFVQRHPRKEASSTKEANIMALYMIQGTYTAEAWAAMAKNPQDRRSPIREVAQKLGGRLIDIYYCFGEYDVVVLAELPDDNAALTTAIAGVTPGHLKAYKTTKLFTVEETMEAMRKAGSLTFQGPS